MLIKVTRPNQFRTMQEFLTAIVVNKGLFWLLHVSTHLRQMQRIGINLWGGSQEPLKRAYERFKRRKNLPREKNNATGQTKDQATFMYGDAEAHITGRGNVLVNINAKDEWIHSPVQSKWNGKYTDRPFWYLNQMSQDPFWQPGKYIDIKAADKNIWKFELPDEEVTLTQAKKYLIMSVNQTRQILQRHMLQLGSWKKGKPKGVVGRWH